MAMIVRHLALQLSVAAAVYAPTQMVLLAVLGQAAAAEELVDQVALERLGRAMQVETFVQPFILAAVVAQGQRVITAAGL